MVSLQCTTPKMRIPSIQFNYVIINYDLNEIVCHSSLCWTKLGQFIDF